MKTRGAVKGSRKSRKNNEPAQAHSSEEARRLLEPGDRSDRDAIGRPVQLEESEVGGHRPQSGGVTEDMPDEQGLGTGRQQQEPDSTRSDRR